MHKPWQSMLAIASVVSVAFSVVTGQAPAAPFVPQPIVTGGQIVTLFPAASKYLKKERIGEAEQNNLQKTVPGRIQSIVNIHNPSIEVHVVDPGINTGAAVIVVPGGGHNTLNVGTEGADFVPFFYNYGVNTIILRNRLRRDGYDPQTDAVNDVLQAIRMVRAHAADWNIDPKKIGMIGFSAGAELAAPAALLFDEFDADEQARRRSAGRRQLAARFRRRWSIPGPTPFARDAESAVPRMRRRRSSPAPARATRVHAIWADEYFAAMLQAAHPEPGDAHLRQRRARQRPEGSQTARRSAPGSTGSSTGSAIWAFWQARRRDQGGEGHRGVRGDAPEDAVGNARRRGQLKMSSTAQRKPGMTSDRSSSSPWRKT